MTVPSQLHVAWKDRIVADQATMDDTTAQLLAARHECQLAEDALTLAAAKVEHLQAEVRLLEQRQSAATEQLARSRAASLRIAVCNLPDDVIRCVFICCAELPDIKWEKFGHGSYNHGRATLPFSLAAVCTRWRRVALDYGGLWTYISLPSIHPGNTDDRQLGFHHNRIETLLLRSQMFLLDVLLDMSPFDGESTWISSVFSSVCSHTDRWRRVEISFPYECERDIASVFAGPLPKLKQLSLLGPATLSLEDENTYFIPHAPLLEDLDLSHTGMTVSPVHEGFPSLLSLAINDDISSESLQQLLELSKATLQVLDLNVGFPARCLSSLSLPNLRTLVLHLELFFVTAQPERTVNFNASSLSALTLRSNDLMFDNDLLVLLEHVSATVTNLTLYDVVHPRYIDTLARLRNLSQIVFGTQIMRCDVHDQFLVVLAKQIPTVWPRLQTIVFCNAEIMSPGSHGNGIMQLVAARNVAPKSAVLSSVVETSDSEHPRRIREVQLPIDTPKWTVAEVERLLAITS
ncbi:hypothetical protein EXIGLDRAFT_733298 [Exidia glandulosa HHB12029]|uniref:F-box domain-containing protein n=1 Tax=Exidia glandulosa HHB12029 TaxID=1314781 RepID=A0A165KI80_EXIGL|nr:hypothetical protein EXIGLDRAFT_733298 [Exidia glandulosa HHB12029]